MITANHLLVAQKIITTARCACGRERTRARFNIVGSYLHRHYAFGAFGQRSARIAMMIFAIISPKIDGN